MLCRANHISFDSLEFNEMSVLAYGSAGTPYTRSVRFGMPKLPPEAINLSVFLYKDSDDAKAGRKIGGSGFVASIPCRNPAYCVLFFVTNWHVACRDGMSCVRVNKLGGGFEIFEYDPSEWTYSTKYDIAVIKAPINKNVHDFCAVTLDSFLTRDIKKRASIGPGDDVFMVGRFVDIDNSDNMTPAVRFGHISLDPTPMEQANGAITDSYCIDMHSRTGFSGSPVFVYRTLGSDLTFPQPPGDSPVFITYKGNHLSLLGIHWGQFPERWEVTENGSLRTETTEDLISGKRYIEGLSGMTCVLPAWAIEEVLNMPKFVDLMKVANIEADRLSVADGPVAEAAGSDQGDDPRIDHSGQGDEILRRMLNTPPKRDH